MGNAVFCEKVKFGRKCFYPSNRTAELFCSLILRSGSGRNIAQSLAEWHLEVIKELGFEVSLSKEVIKRSPRITPEQREKISEAKGSAEQVAAEFGVSPYTVLQIKTRIGEYKATQEKK